MRQPRKPLLLRHGTDLVHAFPAFRGAIIAAADAADPAEPDAKVYTVVGYRQTEKSSFEGGKALNENGWRFRHRSMRAIARTFRGKPFITAHDWGDVRARGGTIVDAWADVPPDGAADELAFFFLVRATAEWALEGFADKTIELFSIGAIGDGEVVCTIHGTPVWSDCWCWPGMPTSVEGVIAEWEYQDAHGVELSAVNVPAVEGTGVVEALLAATGPLASAPAWGSLGEIAGRSANLVELQKLMLGGEQQGGFPPRARESTITSMDPREEMARALGLDPSATWEQIKARLQANAAAASQGAVAIAQLEDTRGQLTAARDREAQRQVELDAAHVASEIARLKASHQISDKVIVSLKATAAGQNGRTAFDAAVRLVSDAAPEIVASPGAAGRAALQSDSKPAQDQSPDELTAEPDAYEQHRTNADLGRMMRICKVSVAQVRQHGPRTIQVQSNLPELIAETAKREASEARRGA